jgi:molecular chaperone DnaJ
MKDYYAILECTPMSTLDEIKRNYRRLAMQFHPDKNAGDHYAAAHFNDIKSAYETLTQPEKKAKWLEERWLSQVLNTNYSEKEPLTPLLILKKVLQIEKYISTLDIYRMDHWTLSNELEAFLCTENLECLKQFNQPEVNNTIIQYILQSLEKIQTHYSQPVWDKLMAFAKDDALILSKIRKAFQQIKRKEKIAASTLPIVLALTILLCLLLFFLSRR